VKGIEKAIENVIEFKTIDTSSATKLLEKIMKIAIEHDTFT